MKSLALAFCLLVLTACATSFNGKLATGYQSVTAVRTTTTTLLQAHKVSPADAQNVQDLADKARTSLDIAAEVHKVTPDLGEDKLASATTILQALQKYLGELLK